MVRRIESLMKTADVIECRVTSAVGRAGTLAQAVLAKTFRGELAPTDFELASAEGRPYESATDLFARVAASADGDLKPRNSRNRRRGT